jgi:hypothetical protein
MKRFGVALAVTALLTAPPVSAASVALVIGNAAYTGLLPVPACAASAGLVARKLTAAGYGVSMLADLSNGALDGAISAFAARAAAAPADPAVVYFCGYGAAFGERDFVLPVSATVSQPSDLLTEGILTSAFVAIGKSQRTAPLLLALDLVRDPGGSLAAASGGLARASLPDGTGLAVVTEAKPPSAPTAFAGEFAAALSAGALPAQPLAAIVAKLPAGGTVAVAGVQDAKPTPAAASAAAPENAKPPEAAPAGGKTLPDDAAMSEADRRQVQIALAGLGYYDGRLDGVFGPDTRAAIRRWQHEKGADMTGRLTAAEATRLVAAKENAGGH